MWRYKSSKEQIVKHTNGNAKHQYIKGEIGEITEIGTQDTKITVTYRGKNRQINKNLKVP
jgi:hypothetical protein